MCHHLVPTFLDNETVFILFILCTTTMALSETVKKCLKYSFNALIRNTIEPCHRVKSQPDSGWVIDLVISEYFTSLL